MSFTTDPRTGRYFKRSQHNYAHGTKARALRARKDANLALIRELDKDGIGCELLTFATKFANI